MSRTLRLTCLVSAFLLAFAANSLAQSAPANGDESGPATTTTSGTTGIWHVPSAAVLPARQWSVSFYRTNIDDGQGFTDISKFPATFAVGLGGRAELFGAFTTITRIDRDTRPLFFTSTPDGTEAGTGGGIMVDHPLVRSEWIGNKVGDLLVGGKVTLLPADSKAALAIRAMAKLPTGDSDSGASSGKADFEVDAVISTFNPVVEVAAYGGLVTRGNPDGYQLTNGLRWGVGAAFPQRYNLGFRLNAELYGEKYFDKTITAPAGLTGTDGSPVPTSTRIKGPAVALVGVTWQAPNGFFVGAAANWNVSMKSRNNAGAECPPGLVCTAVVSQYPDTPKDDKGFEIRIGFHPGARGPRGRPAPTPVAATPTPTPAAPPTPPAAPPAPATPPPPSAPANRPPTVRASCDPCTVEVGRTSTVSADAQDPDGDPLTYQWTTPTGSLGAATARQSVWTAPQQVGQVPVTVAVNDGRGGTARDVTTITVVAARQYTFEDVHFEFDRFNLRPDAIKILDEAVSALQANPAIRLTIEGHTCNIGTPEYNLALGDRRAAAVRNYLLGRGIAADRLIAVSFGEERPKYDNSREETRRQNRRAGLSLRTQ
jgi:outer membrane protein OmpA-like peptidoglycan-associated protein